MKENEHSFYATISAVIYFTDKEFELLLQQASRHHDGTVRASGEVGGFLYGKNNVRNFGSKIKEHEFTIRQIGLMAKSLEMNYSDDAVKLSNRLYGIAMESQHKQESIQIHLK